MDHVLNIFSPGALFSVDFTVSKMFQRRYILSQYYNYFQPNLQVTISLIGILCAYIMHVAMGVWDNPINRQNFLGTLQTRFSGGRTRTVKKMAEPARFASRTPTLTTPKNILATPLFCTTVHGPGPMTNLHEKEIIF